MKKKTAYIFILLLLSQKFYCQNSFPRDTSFTTQSATDKVLKEYPFVKVVDNVIPDSIALYNEVVYESIMERDLHMDIFRNKNIHGKLPLILVIHGGGWRTGNKIMEWPIAIYFAKKGFVTAAVEYRLSPEAKYPAAIFDLKRAIQWLKENASNYNIDENKIAVMGSSAGGELAAFLGTTGDIQKFQKSNTKSTKVQAVVDIDGIVDFTHPAESNKDSDINKPSAGKAWFGFSFDENQELWIEASPMNYLTKDDPPFLFVNSSQPRYHAGRDYMITKMNEFGIYSEIHTIDNTPHPFWLFHPWFDEAVEYILNFLNKHLR